MVWFYGISTIVCYLMPNPFLYIYTVLFQTIQFNISTQFKWQKELYFKQFSSRLFISIWSIDSILSGAPTSGQGVIAIKEHSAFPKAPALSSKFLVSYTGHSLGESFPLHRCSRCILKPQPTGAIYFEITYTIIALTISFYCVQQHEGGVLVV